MEYYQQDESSALDAKQQAQRLAFAPIAFQAARSLRDLGILTLLAEYGEQGASAEMLAQHSKTNAYGIAVLLDMGLSVGLVIWREQRYVLTKLGHFVDYDPMTIANMNFVADVCYLGMADLTEAIQTQQPSGLKSIGDWPTIYQGLSILPEKVKQSWFVFDHYYSDRSFPILLEQVFSSPVQTLCDIGANTGKWTIKCCQHNPDVEVTMVDLPVQLAVALENVSKQGVNERVQAVACDLLVSENSLPKGKDVYWMSQFLDCFSLDEIVCILTRVRQAMRADSKVYILELFPDCQPYESASYALNATSLYFTAIANGNSRFYMSHQFLPLIEQAGLRVVNHQNNIGLGHSLICCERA
ncbi:methyltransferase [Agarivorans sp. QJM3NY_33]|uniref:methyltransferase n=1 Tax=Agarivorans sp. QJM3NY_33 TaxID=3421432 RepID=UPI003D7EE217